MRKHRKLIIFLVLFSCVRAHGNDLTEEFRIRGVKWVGVKNVSKKELAGTLATQAVPMWKFWLPENTLTPGDIEDDLLRISQFYRSRGYYHTQAAYQIEQLPPKPEAPLPRVNITFHVTEGPPVVVETIDVRIDPQIEHISDQTLLERFPLKTGQIFETAKYLGCKKVAKSLLGNQGYPFAELTPRVDININTNRAKITFELNPGKQFVFGSLTYASPVDFVEEEVIRRAMQFKQGETYSTARVEESQRNLYSLDIFKAALIQPVEPDSIQNEIPLELNLKPKKKQNLKFGIGYGSEDGLRLTGAWTYRNVYGWGGKLSASAKRSDIVENAQMEYAQPYFLDPSNTLRGKAGIEREKSIAYTSRKIFANSLIDRILWQNVTGTFGYNLEISRIEDLNTTDPTQLEQDRTDDNYLISSIELDAVHDTTDSNLNPTRGSVVSVAFEQASGFLGSEIKFLKPSVEFKTYQNISGPVLWAGRLRIRTIQETEDTDTIPVFKRLFLGGSNTVRGYGYQKLGPLDLSGTPTGGQSSITANSELRYPIYGDISGVAFLDMGLVDREPFHFNFDDMRYACGVGVRYNTVIGPLRVDFGYKLNPPVRGDYGDTTNPDEEIEERWRIHFSIGQAF